MHANVHSVLTRSNLTYTVHRHADFQQPIQSPQNFAQALGYDIERITKSVLLSAEPEPIYGIAVCSIPRKMNLKSLARLLGARRLHLANAEELQRLTGYPSRGVSPLGIAEVPIYIDEPLLALPSVLIGAGEVGVEIELTPGDLVRLSRAVVAPLTQASTPV